jgi:hypothetical protein
VQDFRAGSVAKNAIASANSSTDTQYSYSTASIGSSYGHSAASSPSQGQTVQDFQLGSASKHTGPAAPASNTPYRTFDLPPQISYSPSSQYSTQSYGQAGQVVQDFQVGSASKHTVANAASASSASTSIDSASFTNNISNYPGGKHYQLEELEDSETCTTDIFLNDDSTLLVGETSGPLYLSGSGSWSTESAANGKTLFEMELNRRYNTGKEASQKTDIGEFNYDVTRTFRGELNLVGGTVLAMNGEILDVDVVFGDRRVSSTWWFCFVELISWLMIYVQVYSCHHFLFCCSTRLDFSI